MLKEKNILIGVCGSIASYKSAELVRLFVKAGANVKVVMTKDAKAFITPLTLSTLSKNPIYIEYFQPDTGEWNNHVELALWADLFVIAPATANTLAKLANGLCDNILCAVYLSAKCNVYFAPAMDLDMWKHAATKSNIEKLKCYGNFLIKPNSGELASGLNGEGRMAEPQEIFSVVNSHFNKDLPLQNKKVLITAGPTYEAIDPVRFIGNHSSGKMGFALAMECVKAGAKVTLICGPTSLFINHPNITRINITTAEEMFSEVKYEFIEHDICIMSAAVADYKPKTVAAEKIKKKEVSFSIDLEKTTDILQYLGQIKTKQILVGFALETNNEIVNAIKKLNSKNLDLIVLNSLKDTGAGFKGDKNQITIIDKNQKQTDYTLKSKHDVAKDIIDKILELI